MRGRTRSKGPNPLTRSYESNGPDVKIRGTAQHVADKYAQLARDAQASGDPVSAENYFQHAEHYYRMISAAQEAQRQQYGGFQRPFDEDGEEGDEDAGAGFGGQGQQGASAGPQDEEGEPGYAPNPYEPRQNGQNQNRYDRNDRQNRPQQRFDRNNGSYDRNGGQDRGGYDRGNDRQERYDRNGNDRNGGYDRNDRPDRNDRQDRNFGGDRSGYDRQQGQGGERQHADRQNGERPYQDRNDRQNGERPYADRNDRRERYQRDNRQDRNEYRGNQQGRGEPRYGAAEAETREAEPGNLPAFLTTPVRQQIAVEADEPETVAAVREAGPEGEVANGEATGIKTRRRRTRKADAIEPGSSPDLLEGAADTEA